jgi:hypothetical protein
MLRRASREELRQDRSKRELAIYHERRTAAQVQVGDYTAKWITDLCRDSFLWIGLWIGNRKLADGHSVDERIGLFA